MTILLDDDDDAVASSSRPAVLKPLLMGSGER
jgi:hypothetical protein